MSNKPFELDRRIWSDSKLTLLLTIFGVFRRIEVQHLFNGQLGAILYNEGVTRVTAHFAVTLVNRKSRENVVEGYSFV